MATKITEIFSTLKHKLDYYNRITIKTHNEEIIIKNMLACLNHTFSLPNNQFSAARIACQQSTDSTGSDPGNNNKTRKLKTSPQLDRWSRARSLRSGRRLDRAGAKSPPPVVVVATDGDSASSVGSGKEIVGVEIGDERGKMIDGGDDVDSMAKSIYMVSDGTGWTAEHAVNAALGQFEHCLVDRNCSVNTHLFSGIEDTEQLMEVIKQAAKEGAMVVFTLADPTMSESAQKACKLWGIPSTDILSPITEAIALHLGVSPLGLPRGAAGRNSQLSDEYFARIEAIEFTIKQDDGALPQNLAQADIVLAGVSRTGKTPLSIYLAQKGYKVANVPLVKDVPVPKTLFEVDPLKVFAMTINPVVLQGIRRARAKGLGFDTEVRTNYSEMDYVKEELDFAGRIFSQNPVWPVIEVTGKAIEEIAAVVLRLYHDRKSKCTMPRISKRY